MSQSIKLNDNNFVDATGIYDSTLNKTQRDINDFITQLPFIEHQTLPSQSTDNETYFSEWLDYIINGGFLREQHVCIAAVNPNLQGWCIGYGTANGNWCSFLANLFSTTTLIQFGKNNGTWFYSERV